MRTKPKASKIKNNNEANTALGKIAICELKLSEIDGDASIEVGKIKEQAAKAGEALRREIQSLGEGVNLYADYNKDELFSNKRSVDFSYGTIGFRKSTKVKTKKSTLELLKKLFQGKGINVKESIDKTVLSEWDDELLAQVDAAKVTDDTFYYETNKDEVNKNLLNQES
jgi:phage host-nuclease inhibitor protein Gam